VWARRHIDELLGYPAIQGPYDRGHAKAKQTAIELALAHALLTEFTAFVAIDEQPSAAGGPVRTIEQPVQPVASAPMTGNRSVRVPSVRRAAAAVVALPLDKDAIREVVRAHVKDTRRCYNRALDRDRTIAGRVVISFVITAKGVVASSIVQENDTDFEFGDCVARVIKSLQFPATNSWGNVVVSYPFNFQVRPHSRPYGEFEPD
jgi:outer membrane biosynthesis protein TonB